MLLKLYVAVVAALAVAISAWAAVAVPAPYPGAQQLRDVVLLGLLVLLAERLQVRHYHDGDHVGALNLMEGILAPLVFLTSGATATVVCAVAIFIADAVGSNDRIKVLFNVAQWTLATAVGSLVVHALRPTRLSDLAVIVIAMLVMSIVNQAAISTVLAIATGAATGERPRQKAFLVGVLGRLVSNGVALTTGLCLIALYRWNPWLLVLGVGFLVGIAATGRANAALHADRLRLEGLQRATHALATSLDVNQALPVFLAEARIGFEARAVQLVRFTGKDAPPTVHTCTDRDGGTYDVAVGPHELAELLAVTLTQPAHLSLDTVASDIAAALEETGHQRAVAVPLRAGADTTGMLLLYDRVGMEGFEAGELSVGAALARELVSFLERVALIQAIDEERNKLADILGSTSDGILTVDADGLVTSWNQGLAVMTGYSAEEMVGTRHIGLLRTRDAAGRDVLVERWIDDCAPATGAVVLPTELQIVTADGDTVWLSCSYSRIPAAEQSRDVLVVVARNVTQARELEKLKDDFVAVVSHELRTPLVPIKGWAQTLINRGDRLTDDQRRTAVQSILSQAQKLESLVLNILEASRIESGRVDGDGAADVGAIAKRIVDDTVAARPDRVVRMPAPATPCQVYGSAVWVERAVSNLIANAVKYSPDEEPVDVTVRLDGDDVVVSVTDRGPGIAAEAQDRIFERFERLEETRTQTGTGLGLYITRRLARAMGGDVSVSSVPGAGSTFLLRLPAVKVARVPEPRPTRDSTVTSIR
jgi:PAS domain S-box-containing protein